MQNVALQNIKEIKASQLDSQPKQSIKSSESESNKQNFLEITQEIAREDGVQNDEVNLENSSTIETKENDIKLYDTAKANNISEQPIVDTKPFDFLLNEAKNIEAETEYNFISEFEFLQEQGQLQYLNGTTAIAEHLEQEPATSLEQSIALEDTIATEDKEHFSQEQNLANQIAYLKSTSDALDELIAAEFEGLETQSDEVLKIYTSHNNIEEDYIHNSATDHPHEFNQENNQDAIPYQTQKITPQELAQSQLAQTSQFKLQQAEFQAQHASLANDNNSGISHQIIEIASYEQTDHELGFNNDTIQVVNSKDYAVNNDNTFKATSNDNVNSKSIAEQVAFAIRASKENDQKSLIINLEPADLGNIEMAFKYDKDGAMKVSIACESFATLSMLKTAEDKINAILTEHGFDTNHSDLEFSFNHNNKGQHETNQDFAYSNKYATNHYAGYQSQINGFINVAADGIDIMV